MDILKTYMWKNISDYEFFIQVELTKLPKEIIQVVQVC